MSDFNAKWIIVGQGLAGTCLAWALWQRGEKFQLIDDGLGGSSRIAAGMINPITGKNFEPSWRIGEFLPEALELYAAVGKFLSRQLWFPYPVVRLAATAKEWQKISGKLDSPWVERVVEPPAGWVGAVRLHGGGRLDTRAFLEGSREFFMAQGRYTFAENFTDGGSAQMIRCEGAAGLLAGRYGPHRCAKGEILTVKTKAWNEEEIRIGAGGWLVPLGDGYYRVGSTYEWHELDALPTAKGRARVEEIASRLLGTDDFEVTAHDAGVRPILRRSQPLIGPLATGEWMFNGLGSKGSLYAPGMARQLAAWLVDGEEPEAEVDFRVFLKESSSQ
jgi:glycine oxidase